MFWKRFLLFDRRQKLSHLSVFIPNYMVSPCFFTDKLVKYILINWIFPSITTESEVEA